MSRERVNRLNTVAVFSQKLLLFNPSGVNSTNSLLSTNCLSVFDHFVRLTRKRLRPIEK